MAAQAKEQGRYLGGRPPIWTTTADAESLASHQYPLGYVLNLKLTNPADAESFADRFDPGGARTSTVDALADAARPPRRHARLTAYSTRLPASLLLATRLAVRRPRRLLLGSLSIAVTVSGIVAVLFAHATLAIPQSAGPAVTANPGLADVGFIAQTACENQVLLTITVMLVALAAVNVTFITWATVQDSRHATALTRALGATAGQLTAGLSAAQLFPASVGALAGIAGGYALFTAANQGASASQPPAWWLITALLGTLIAVAGLTAVPARLAARTPIAETLQADRW